MNLELQGLKAILAGGTKGIGRATAEVLASEGCHVAVCSRSAESVEATVVSLRGKGVKATGRAVDVARAADYAAWIADAAEELGGCDVFMSFTTTRGPASEELWKQMFELDLMATVRGIQAALPFLEKSSSASVVAIASTAALEDFLGPSPFNALKAAMIRHAASMAQSLAAKGIRVNTVSPGPIDFPGGAWEMIKEKMPALHANVLKSVPMGRMGTAEEVARVMAFLASPACRFMTGANVVIDGGMTKGVHY